jgi:AmmeMemoRadiSam system protein A
VSGLGDVERDALLRIARAALESEIHGGSALALPRDLPDALRRPSGAFVSLHTEDVLRGCIGYVEPRWPLAETVVRAAGGAATRDRRFAPVTAAELADVQIEVSVLTAPVPILAGAIEIGVHGLIIECDGRSGLLLPQVPRLYGWDRETFLQHLCRKAGLPGESWRRTDAGLLAFTADVFADPVRRPT